MQRLRFSRYFKGLIILLDIIILASVFLVFFIQRNKSLQLNDFDWEQSSLSILLLSLFWVLLSGRTKLYDIPRSLTYTLYLERILTHMIIFLLGIILLGKVSNNVFLKNERFTLAILLSILFLLLKSFIFFSLKYVRSRGVNYRNIMFLGIKNDSQKILELFLKERTDYGFKIFDYPEEEINIEALKGFWKKEGIYTLYLSINDPLLTKEKREEIYSEAEKNKVRIALIPEIDHHDYFHFDISYVGTQPVFMPTKFPLDYNSNYILKRVFDVFFSLLVLVLICSWLFPIIGIFIKLNSEGPVFFKQKRYGFHDEVFNCIKFRTMVLNPDSSTKTTKKNDERITSLGKMLRKTSLDEMPQFINVLLGDMSVVGPRPHMLLIDNYYKDKIGRYSIRSLVKPGITGLAQVNGLRGDDGNMNIEMKKRVLADTFYVKNWSFILDFVIISKTIFLVIMGDKKAR